MNFSIFNDKYYNFQKLKVPRIVNNLYYSDEKPLMKVTY